MRQDKGNGLASTDHEFTDCFEIFSVEIGRVRRTKRSGPAIESMVPSSARVTHGTVAP